jgi:hypothetical protein
MSNGQTPLSEQVGQQVGNLLANKFSGAPDTSLLYNLLGAGLARASKLVGDVAQQVGQLVRIAEFGRKCA